MVKPFPPATPVGAGDTVHVRELQERVDERYGEGDRRVGREALAAVLAEEVGELATAARQGDDEALGREAADVAFLAVCLANLAGADLEDRLQDAYLEAGVEDVAEGWETGAREAHGLDGPEAGEGA